MKSKKSTEAQQSQLQLLRTASTFWRFRKSFNKIKAVDDVNFCIKKGEVVALLGPNGAGKTTLM